MILENLLFLSSFGITPSTRVANGFSCLFNKTTELELYEIVKPTERRNTEFVFTTTPCNTSPFFTFPLGFKY